MTPPPVIDIRDITKSYTMGGQVLPILKGISLQIGAGEYVSIMGPSGSGKSTLMNILGALDQPTSGDYYLNGRNISQMNGRELAQVRNKAIGFVFQNFNLLKRVSAVRQVELPLIYGGGSRRRERAIAALTSVGLEQRLDHLPNQLSGGQQQRVAIARALVNEPSMLLGDEPTGNLDSQSGQEVMKIFQHLNRDKKMTIVIVTHDTWVARHTDRVIVVQDGYLLADHRIQDPLVAGESQRPSDAEELEHFLRGGQ